MHRVSGGAEENLLENVQFKCWDLWKLFALFRCLLSWKTAKGRRLFLNANMTLLEAFCQHIRMNTQIQSFECHSHAETRKCLPVLSAVGVYFGAAPCWIRSWTRACCCCSNSFFSSGLWGVGWMWMNTSFMYVLSHSHVRALLIHYQECKTVQMHTVAAHT